MLGIMKIEPPNLNVPLYRRDFSKLTAPVMAGLAAWLWHRPTAIPQAAVSFTVGGAFLWFALGSTVSYRISHHRIPVVRGAWFVVVVLGVVLFMRNVIPYLHALV